MSTSRRMLLSKDADMKKNIILDFYNWPSASGDSYNTTTYKCLYEDTHISQGLALKTSSFSDYAQLNNFMYEVLDSCMDNKGYDILSEYNIYMMHTTNQSNSYYDYDREEYVSYDMNSNATYAVTNVLVTDYSITMTKEFDMGNGYAPVTCSYDAVIRFSLSQGMQTTNQLAYVEFYLYDGEVSVIHRRFDR